MRTPLWFGGTIASSAVATDDTYPETVIGNVQIDSKNVQPNAFSVLGNDYLGSNPAATITAFDSTSVHGGNVTVRTTGGPGVVGTFIYDPPAGYEGSDSFTYTLSDAAGDKGSAAANRTGTVNLTVSGMVWFINNNSAGCTSAGCGRLTSPFSTLAAFNTLNDNGGGNHPGNSDNIFIYESASDYTGGVTLLTGQKLFGQDSTSSLATLTALTPPSGSASFPAMNSGNGTVTRIANSGGDGVRLNTNNTLNGFTVGDTNRFDVSCTPTSTVGNLTIANVILTGTGGLFSADSGGALNVTFDSASTTNGNTATSAIQLVNTTGTFTVNGSGNISGVSGADVLISGGSATISIASSITNTAGRSVDIQSRSGNPIGTVTFSGAINDTGTGIFLDNNDLGGGVGTMTFTGGMTINTGANPGFTATNGGIVNVTGTNTIVTTTATALNVANTTIGASGLTFKSISAGTGATGPASGIILNNTGGTAGLTVTGTGTTAGSGGTIQNCTQKGADFRTASDISLSNMNFTNNATANLGASGTCGDALNGTNGPTNCNSNISLSSVTTATLTKVSATGSKQIGIDVKGGSNLTLTNMTVTGNGNETMEDGVQITDLTGTLTISGGTFKDNASNQFEVQNGVAGPAFLTVNADGATFSNTTFPVTGSTPSNTTSNSGLFLATHNSAVMNPTITNCTVDKIYAQGIRLDMAGSSSMTANIGPATGAGNGNTITNSNQAISITGSNTGGMTYNVRNNTTNITVGVNPDNGATNQISVNRSTASGTWTGLIENNTTGTAGQVNSTCQIAGCQGIDITNNSAGIHKLSILGNAIHDPEGSGMSIISGGAPDSSTVSWIIKNNTITNPDQNADQANPAIIIQSGTSAGTDSTDTCLEISGNTITGLWSPVTTSKSSIRVRSLTTASGSFAIVGFNPATDYPDDPTGVVGSTTGPGGDIGNVADYIRQQNPGVSNASPGQNAASANKLAASPAFTQSAGCPLLLAEGGVMAALNAPSLVTSLLLSSLSTSPITLDARRSTITTPNSVSASLDQQQLDSIVAAAIGRWSATGLPAQQIATLRAIEFEVADLSGSYLGEADGNRILVDRDAGGKGWYVGTDSLSDSLFDHAVSATRRYTDPMNAPAGRLDLLTAIEHEMGHKLGLDDSYAKKDRDSIMYGYLTVGERRVPAKNQAVGAKPNADARAHFLSLATATEGSRQKAEGSQRTEIRDQKSDIRLNHALNSKLETANSKLETRNAKLSAAAPVVPPVDVVIGSMQNGRAVIVKFAVTVNDPLSPTSTASVQTQGSVKVNTFLDTVTNDPDTGAANDATVTLIAHNDLALTGKTDGVTTINPGQTLTYVISYSNPGRDAAGVRITETVPTGTTFNNGASTAGWVCAPNGNAGSTCTFAVGALSSGGSGTVNFAVDVNNPAASGLNSLSNTASIDSTDTTYNNYEADINPGDNSASDTNTILNAAPAFGTFTKDDGVASTTPGSTLTYTINYANTGNQDAAGVGLTETVPTGTTFVAAGSSVWTGCADGAAAATVCTISVGNLAGGGGSGSATFKVKVNNPVAGGLNNIVNNTSITDDGANSPAAVTANTSDTDTLNAAPDLSISKTPDVTNASPGNNITYTINYSNVGNQSATGVVVTETVPANTTFVAAGSSTWTGCADGAAAATVCTNTIGALAGGGAGGSLTFKVKVDNAAPPNTTITNVATIDDDHANGTDPNTANNTTGNVNTPTCGNPQTVTTTADSGAGSLRQALIEVCDGGAITFNIPTGDGGHIGNKYTITLGGTELAIAKSVTITGPNNNGTDTDPIVISGNNASRVFNITSGTVTLDTLTITKGLLNGGDGGGILNAGTLNVLNSTVSDNQITSGNGNSEGGGIANLGGSLTVTNSTISGNKADGDGGNGGGIYNAGGTTKVTGSTLSNNTATGNPGGGFGGGIANNTSSTVIVTNSTLTGNTASSNTVFGSAFGGGIGNGGTLSVTNCTISSNTVNSSASSGGGIDNGGTVNIRNTIVAGNSVLGTAPVGPDVHGNFNSQGHNLIGKGDDSTGFSAAGDQVGTVLSPLNAQLAPLANNGGLTQTRALCAANADPDASCTGASPAINAGDDCVTQAAHCGDANIPQLTSDQRGAPFVRLIGTHVDIGAFEAPHHAPTSSNSSATTLEDTDYVFVLADFPFSDANDNPADTFTKVKITSLATAGTLYYDADGAGGNPPAAVAQNDLIPVADITAGDLFFTPAANANGVPYATFGFAVQDNGSADNNGADTSGNYTFTMNVTATNDAPSLTAGGTLSYTENDAASVIDNTITVNDIDSVNLASATVQITANYVNGEDVLSFTNTANISGNFVPGTGTLTLTGSDTLANYQTALRSVKYHNTSDAPSTSARTVSWTVNDGGSNSNTATSTINVTAVNDAPTLDNSGSPALTAINEDDTTNNGTAVSAIIAALGGTKIQDADSGAVQGLAVTGVDNTNGAWQFSTNNGGTWTPFGSPADASARLLASDANTRIRFVPATDFNGTVNPGITFRAWDQTSGTNGTIANASTNGGTTAFSTASETASITVNPVNDPPVVTTTAGNLNYTENDPATAIDPGLTVTDVDNANLTGATVAITAGFVSAQDTLGFTNQLGITGNYSSGTGVLTLTGTTTLANYQTALRSVTYQNSSDAPTASRTITFTANDGTDTGSATRGITISAVNDGPVNTVPGSQTDSVNTPLVFSSGNGNQISIADIDAGANMVKVTLTATNGTLTLSTTAGLAFTTGDGTADPTMVFTGTIANINAALNGMTFNPTPAYTGPASVQITTDDQGNTGSGGAKTDTDTVTITVTSVDLKVIKTHSGNFKQADTGKTYTIKVSNIGSNPSSGTVTLTDNLPAGLTATGWGGTGWNNCTATPVTGPAVLTCDRSDPVAANGGVYPDLTLTVDVSCTAAANITNKATVSGGGDSAPGNNTANDPTTVDPDTTPPVITCPGGITRFVDSGQNTATINPGAPIASDNCGTPTITGARSDGKPLNAPYPVGTTIITWTAKDAANNTASCAQTIIVMTPSGEMPHRLPPEPDDELLLSMTNLLVSLLAAGW